MPELIDVMTLLPDHSPYFTVDTSGPLSVDILRPTHIPAYDYLLRNAGGKKTFAKGDDFTVLSAGFIFPESFGLAKAPSNQIQNNPSIVIAAKDIPGGGTYFIPNFGTNGIQIPIENYEFPINIFVDMNKLAAPLFLNYNFNLFAAFSGLDELHAIFPKVSMVGVPVVLNGTVQHLTVFVKVTHNFPLT
jgi:hypothetical protein